MVHSVFHAKRLHALLFVPMVNHSLESQNINAKKEAGKVRIFYKLWISFPEIARVKLIALDFISGISQ